MTTAIHVYRAHGNIHWSLGANFDDFLDFLDCDPPRLAEADRVAAAHGYRRVAEWAPRPRGGWGARAEATA